jgi:lipopolysaccharide/colanic/teichoic acid biosynthesis glycosyltransferase
MAASIISRQIPGQPLGGLEQLAIVPMPAWKRAIDIAGASLGLVLTLPLILVISLAIVLDSRGGPFYRQLRVGHGGKLFLCWKFRSMHRFADSQLSSLLPENEAEGLIFKIKDDPRRTRVGKFVRRTSLDELPQLWNVLRGEMSLVGPRPPTVAEVLRYDEAELGRLAAAPGITGLWQVTLRRVRHDFEDMVELDTRYAREMCFLLDARILLRTIPTVLFGQGSF